MRELFPYLRLIGRRRGRLLVGMLLLLLTVLAAVGLLALSGWFITATAVTALLWAAGTQIAFDIYIPGGAIRFFAVTRTVARYFERVYNHDTVLRLLADLRSGVFTALTRLDPITLKRLRAGLLLNRLTADIDALDNLYLRLAAPPVVALLGSLGVAGLLGWQLVPAGAASLTVLGVLLLLTTLICARSGLATSALQVERAEQLRIRLIEQFQGLAELSAYNTLARHRRLLLEDETRFMHGQQQLGRRLASWNALVTAMIHGLMIGILMLALYHHHHAGDTSPFSVGMTVLMPLAILALTEAFTGLPNGYIQFGATCAAARRLTAEANRQPLAQHDQVPPPPPLDNTLTLHQLDFRHSGTETAVLQTVDLTVRYGEQLMIMGHSGAGKSTLAELLAGLRPPDAGSVQLGGTDMRLLAAAERRRRIAYLTQRSDLFEASIATNLRIADPAATDEALWQALANVELATWVQQLPQQLQTNIGESGRRVSGGQGRRLALARLLLRQPHIVILDEPFSSLDKVTAETVAAAISPWLQQRTAIVLGHGHLLLQADRVLRLEAGRLRPA